MLNVFLICVLNIEILALLFLRLEVKLNAMLSISRCYKVGQNRKGTSCGQMVGFKTLNLCVQAVMLAK